MTAVFFLDDRSYSEKYNSSSRTFWEELRVFSATATSGPLTAIPMQRPSSFVKKIGEPSSFAFPPRSNTANFLSLSFYRSTHLSRYDFMISLNGFFHFSASIFIQTNIDRCKTPAQLLRLYNIQIPATFCVAMLCATQLLALYIDVPPCNTNQPSKPTSAYLTDFLN